MNVHEIIIKGSDNEKESELCLSEKMSESSLEMESMIAKIEGISGSTYLSTNNLNFALLSVSYFVQVKQSAIALVLSCSIPTSIGELKSFHGVGVLSVALFCYQHVFKLQARDSLTGVKGVHVQ